VAANQPVPIPDLDSLWIDFEQLRHFFDGQHACIAETIVTRFQVILPLNAGHDTRGERLAFPGLHGLVVQHGSDVRIGVFVQQSIDLGHHLRAGLPLLPRSQRQRELHRAMGATLEA
jgi:hypothetical protein